MTTQAHAFLLQAEDDYRMFITLQAGAIESTACQPLHYLQMCWEKVAKAYLLGGGWWTRLKATHYTSGDFLAMLVYHLGRDPEFANLLEVPEEQANDILQRVKTPWAGIQSLVPTREEDKVNAEYPWRSGESSWTAPCRHTFEDIWTLLDSRSGRLAMGLLNRLVLDDAWHKRFSLNP